MSEYGIQMGEPETQLEKTLVNQKTALRKRLNEIRRLEDINRDLLAALKEAQRIINHCVPDSEIDAWCQFTDAAIAKAEVQP